MNLDDCKLAICPHCGHKKDLIRLLSGNSQNAQQWSDGKQIRPMYPKVSPVQKCPECGHFYFMSDVEIEEGNTISFQQGWLSFEDAVQAYDELSDRSNLDKLELLTLVLTWAYNDIIRNFESPTEEQFLILKNIQTVNLLQPIFKDNELIRAEINREIMNFDACIHVLENFNPAEDYVLKIKNTILFKAKEKKYSVFLIR